MHLYLGDVNDHVKHFKERKKKRNVNNFFLFKF